ncbi:MAG TPA: hypothetical protein VK989_17640 [Polyangia bacterium]|jgi:hypothetical protein|nr:hypothetical protein [Polyangia bacterium]
MRSSSTAHLHAPLALAIVTLVGACRPKDLPNDQLLTSAHFRYHARADAVLDPTIMDRLETHRTEFDATYGVEPGIVDYYRFRDFADLAANSGCPVPCTGGRSVMAVAPLHEHELVHAFMADIGEPARVVAEGVAQYAACIQPNLAFPVDPAAWAAAVSSGGYGNESSDEALYDFGQRLVAWMRAQGPPARFVDFYRDGIATFDPALFDVQFERTWGRRLSDVAAEIDVDRYAGSFCPCTAPAVPADGSSISFAAGEEYRTLEVAQESRVELTNDGTQQVFPASCARSGGFGFDLTPQPTGPTVTVARMGAGRYLVATPGIETGTATVRQVQAPEDDWSCEAALAAPVHVGSEEVVLWVTADRASVPSGTSDLTWFALDLDAPHLVGVVAEGTLVVCEDECGEGGTSVCSSLSADGEEITLSPTPRGPVLVGLGRSPDPPVAESVGIRVRPAP